MAENGNEQITPEELEAIKAQLAEEQQAKAALEEAAAGKDSRIAELEGALSEAKQASEAKGKELLAKETDVKTLMEVRDETITKYLTMARALNPNIPAGIIGGATIQDIDASVEKGKAVVEAVKKAIESEAAAARVPAGAPTRAAISTEGMSPREKITAGISRPCRETGGG